MSRQCHQNNITSFNGNGVSIIADGSQNALVVKADPQLMREIESAIQQLDTRRQQVLIEAAIIEVEGTDADQLGVQWALGDLSSGIGLINFDNIGASLKNELYSFQSLRVIQNTQIVFFNICLCSS